jgi:hypothetical protein
MPVTERSVRRKEDEEKTPSVFIDANVLASKTQLDWLYFLTKENPGMYELYTSRQVLEETTRKFIRRVDKVSNPTEEQRDFLNTKIDEVLAGRGTSLNSADGRTKGEQAAIARLKLISYVFAPENIFGEDLNQGDRSGFTGKDPDDFHVHNGAIQSSAKYLVTNNRETDFTTTPGEEGYDVITPDQLFIDIFEANPSCLLPIMEQQQDYWLNSRRDMNKTMDQALRDAGCLDFAQKVKEKLPELKQQHPELFPPRNDGLDRGSIRQVESEQESFQNEGLAGELIEGGPWNGEGLDASTTSQISSEHPRDDLFTNSQDNSNEQPRGLST